MCAARNRWSFLPTGRYSHTCLYARGHPRPGQGNDARSVAATGADILLGNTYHLMFASHA